MSNVMFTCPECSQHISCDESYRGDQLQCPTCQHEVTVPRLDPPNQVRGSFRRMHIVVSLIAGFAVALTCWYVVVPPAMLEVNSKAMDEISKSVTSTNRSDTPRLDSSEGLAAFQARQDKARAGVAVRGFSIASAAFVVTALGCGGILFLASKRKARSTQEETHI